MADNITATPPDAAANFLKEWHKTTTSKVHVFQDTAGPYKMIELHNFKFLGKTFQPQSYRGTKDGKPVDGTTHTGAGVCAEFRDILFKAQHLIFRSYAAEVRSKGGEPTESGFASWCQVGVLSGWQFRSRQHSKGAAIDIDAKFNPYVPTGNPETQTFGGEFHSNVPSSTLDVIYRDCVDVYQRAFDLVWGKDYPAEAMAARNPSDDTGRAYDQIHKVHLALVVYFQLAFLQTKDDRLARSFGPSRPFGPESEPGSFLFVLKQHTPLIKGPVGSDKKAVFEQIRDDYEVLRLGMVYGSLKKESPGHMNRGAIWENATRDPSYGFISIHRDVAVGLRAAGCRWGAIDFGPKQSGDIMHFDKRFDIKDITHTEDPNPDGLLYVRA